MGGNYDSPGVCRRCGRSVDGDEQYCSQCEVELEEEHIEDTGEEGEDLSPPVRSLRRLVIQLALLLAFTGLIAFRIPSVISAFEDDQPIRKGTYATDAETDQCIENLWKVSRMLEDGILPDKTMVCPASGKPYIVLEDPANTTVYCPDPQAHGLKEIRVSRMFPCPEVVE